ncbi:MAG: MoaD/ThiS family protein, partial [Anaerolineales bacterium]
MIWRRRLRRQCVSRISAWSANLVEKVAIFSWKLCLRRSRMIINVRFFALTREITGKPSYTCTFPADATLADFAHWLYTTYPAMEPLRVRFAINMAYAPLETVLHNG